MSARLVVALLAAGALLTVGCGSDDTTSTGSGSPATTEPTGSGGTTGGTAGERAADDLAGTSWVLVSFKTADGTTEPAVEGATATLDLRAGGELGATTGCNTVLGTYAVDGAALTITLGPTTLIGCTDPALSAQEAALMELLPQAVGYAVDGSTLVLTGADGATLLTYEAGTTELAGTSWQVTGVNNGADAVESTALTEALTAEFAADGTFSGAGGCNRLAGPYVVGEGGSIEIGPLAASMMACEPDVSALEAQYTAALEAATTYELSGGTLTLRDDSGAAQVTARPAG